MLERKEFLDNKSILGVWKITETTEELYNLLPEYLKSEGSAMLKKIKSEARTAEWLAVRIMLHNILNKEKKVEYNESGAPYLTDNSYYISISHTKNYAVLLLHHTKKVGIDIETRSSRVEKVAYKFISDKEQIDPKKKATHQLLHWSAKETLFKVMEETEIDFKKHLYIEPFIPLEKGVITAVEFKSGKDRNFLIYYEVHPDYVLTWTTEK
ncbi:MAG: 4'-phosphopantetheinyl transferase superfamily protein [Dysgonamonadaceae bacterium]